MNFLKHNYFAVILFVAGLVFVLYTPVMSYYTGKALEEVHTVIAGAVTAEDIIKNNKETSSAIASDKELFDYSAVEATPAVAINPVIDKSSVMGRIEIPSVGVTMPILYGTTNANLATSATTMKSTQEMGKGNYTLAGHNSRNPKSLFAPIRNIEKGSSIFVTDKQHWYEYKVKDSTVVAPSNIEVLDDIPGETTITLVSCYSKDGSDRIIVTGELEAVNDYRQ